MIAHGLSLPHGHLPVFGVSVHVVHLLLVAMLAMLVVVIASVLSSTIAMSGAFSESPEA